MGNEFEAETVLVAYPRGLLERKEFKIALSRLLARKAIECGLELPSWFGDDELVLPKDQADELADAVLKERRIECHLVNGWPKDDEELKDRFRKWVRIHKELDRARG